MLVNNSYIGVCFIQNIYILKTLFKVLKYVDGLRVYNCLKIKIFINNVYVYVIVYMYFQFVNILFIFFEIYQFVRNKKN